MAQGSWAWIQFVEGSPGGPVDPGYGRPPSPGHGHIDNTLPGGGPVDPGFGNRPPDGNAPLPIWPIDGEHPIAPPIAGHPLPPIDPPPGTIWPPLPPGTDIQPGEKAVVLVAIEGVGYRYVVIEMGDSIDNELPGEGGEAPDNTLPSGPPPVVGNRPPGVPPPPRPDAGLPPAPARPGTPLPPTAQPKPGLRR